MSRVAVLGTGGWGTALSVSLAGGGHQVTQWGRTAAVVREMAEVRENRLYLPGVTLPETLRLETDLEATLQGADALVVVVPAQAVRGVMSTVARHLRHCPLIISCTKGIEQGTHLRMSEVIASVLPAAGRGPIVALSGPNHAEEVGRRLPSATVVASHDLDAACAAQELFMSPYFRVYTNSDLVGVELAGALKNVIALASGISDGLGFGDNTKAALMTRGMAELARLGAALGANPLTFAGLAGMGDLIATCTSRHSRNRQAGEEIGRGRSVAEILANSRMVVEGIWTTAAAVQLAESCGVELPIARTVRDVLFGGKPPQAAVAELMERDPRAEEVSPQPDCP